MPGFLPGIDTHDPGPQVLAPIPYPLSDLWAFPSFKVQIDHSAQTICVSGFIRNIGNRRVRDPFHIAMGITYVRAGVTISSEKINRINETILVGEQIETPCMLQNLVYLDEDPGAYYEFEMIVDLYNDISELKSTNNRHREDRWFFLSPAAKKADEFVIDIKQ
jgi:hypothetical protein